MIPHSIVGITKVGRVEDKAEIRANVFLVLDQLQRTCNWQLVPTTQIMIKVNLCSVKGYETGTTVDPFVVRCLVEWLLIKHKPKIIYIAEADATELNADIAFKTLGWETEFANIPKVEFVNLSKDERVNVNLKGGLLFSNLDMSRKYMESDFLISFAKLKTNNITGLTCILKNQFGATPEKYKAQYHSHLNEAIYDLNLVKRPNLCVVDGIISMEGEGPVAGIPKPMGLLIAGNDPVSTDHACAEIMQIPLRKILHLKLAIKKKLGNANYQVVCKSIDEVKEKFRQPSSLSKIVGRVYQSGLLGAIMRFGSKIRHKENNTYNQIKVGIVGLGAVSELIHLPVLQSLSNVDVIAACETNPERRERRSKEWGIPFIYENYKELYDKADLDAVFICLPTQLHYQATKEALQHGLHVFCEKPMGLSSEKAHELVTIAKERNLHLTVGYSRMLSDNYKKTADIISSLRLGRILQIRCILANPGPYVGWNPRSDWFFDEKGGGALFDSGSHLFSIITYILDERIVSVSASSKCTYDLANIDDQVVGSFQTKKGILGSFNIGWRAANQAESIEIIGTAGSLIVDSFGIEERYSNFGSLEKLLSLLNITRSLFWNQLLKLRTGKMDKSYLKEDSVFIGAAEGERVPMVTGEDAVHILAILEAVKESMEMDRVTRVAAYE